MQANFKCTNIPNCPICAKQPKLRCIRVSGLPKEYKYFCGVHCSIGDWFRSPKAALTDWVDRVNTRRGEAPECEWLTRDDLLKMDGNPIWVEWAPGFALGALGWHLVDLFYPTGAAVCRHTRGTIHGIDILFMDDYSRYWIAFRQQPEKGKGRHGL